MEDAAVAYEAGAIVFVGPADLARVRFAGAEFIDHGNAAIVPGFVNCHSHLEITGMRNQLEDVEHDFMAWLLKLTALRQKMSDEEIEAFAIAGAREGARAGVTCFGDIGRRGHAGLNALKTVGLRGIVYQETEFSPDNRTAEADFLALATKFEALKSEETDLVHLGLSPHSPYTVSSRLFELVAEYAIINRIPLSIHAAESKDEHELLTAGGGLFTAVYENFGVEWQSPACTPIEYLERLGVLSARPLLAHCVTVSDSDISRIAYNGASIAHCPKSNAKFGHGYAPFEKFLDEAVAVGFGSDSVASNNLCDIVEEGRFAALVARNRQGARRFISPREVLETATIGGAQALALDHLIGSLEQDKQADLAVISLEQPALKPLGDIEAGLVYASSSRDVIETIAAGKSVYSAAD
jgi:5-methylthioadenosine/S-adenosylhomocysteine deaminase